MTNLIKLFEKQLAALFDKLRIASPVVYLFIMILIFGTVGVIENVGDLANSFPWLFTGIVDEIFQAIIAILLSSRTKRYLWEADDSPEGLKVHDIDHDD